MPTSPDNDLESPPAGLGSNDSWFSPDDQPLRLAMRLDASASLTTKDPGPVNPTLTNGEPENS